MIEGLAGACKVARTVISPRWREAPGLSLPERCYYASDHWNIWTAPYRALSGSAAVSCSLYVGYAKRGALKGAIVKCLREVYPREVTTNEIALGLHADLRLDFATPAACEQWVHN